MYEYAQTRQQLISLRCTMMSIKEKKYAVLLVETRG